MVAKPDVYKSQNTDTYIVFGEAKVEDMNAAAQGFAAEQARMKEAQKGQVAAGKNIDASELLSGVTSAAQPAEEGTSGAADDEDEEVDETGVEAKDIDLVMQQANVSRKRAVKALKANKNDIVNAIMVFLSFSSH